jgi:hypothetical protein
MAGRPKQHNAYYSPLSGSVTTEDDNCLLTKTSSKRSKSTTGLTSAISQHSPLVGGAADFAYDTDIDAFGIYGR